MIKKIALIILFVGATIGVAFLLYRFFFAGAPATTPTGEPPVTTPGGGLPTAGEGQPGEGGEVVPGGLPTAPGVPVAEEEAGAGVQLGEPGTYAISASPTSSGLNYLNGTDGRFYRIDGDGNAVRLSERQFAAVEETTWSKDGNKAVLMFPDESKIVYDFETQTQVTLPKHWEDFSFSDDGETIVAKSLGFDPANRWLVAAASDGTGVKLIEPLGENEDKVVVSVSPDASIVAFSDTGDPVGFDSRDILLIGQNGENLRALRVEGFDFTPQWSPEGGRLVYSAAGAADDYAPMLWAVRADGNTVGGSRVKLNVKTWADKCTFVGDDTMYCGVPTDLPTGAGLQRDIADGTPDRLVKIDLVSGNSRDITPLGFEATVDTLILSDASDALFVADSEGQLTRVDLF